MEESLKLKNKRPSSYQGPESSSSQGPGTSSSQGPGTSSSQGPGSGSSQGPGTSSSQGPGTSSSQGPGTSSSQGPGSSSSQGPAESSKRTCTELAKKASSALECDVCCNVFSDENCPRNLPCAHTFCGPCIDGIIATRKKTCPTCKEKFTATSAEDLMINRSLLDVVRQLSTTNLKPKTLSKGPTESYAGFPKDSRKKLSEESVQETEARVSGAKKILDGMKDVFTATETLNEMKEGLLETKKEIGRFKEMLSDVELSIEKILSEINKSGDQLEAATDLSSTDPFHDAHEKVKEIKYLFQKNQREREDIAKEILQMKRRLKTVAEDVEETFGMDPAVEKEPRFAVKVIGGKQMVAPVKTRRQVWLSHFAEVDVLPKSFLIKHEALMKTSSRRAFLDLGVGGAFLTRIIIMVQEEGNLALNFLHMCSGDQGPSYANSQFSSVDGKGEAGECVFVDDFKESAMEVDWDKEGQREIYKRTPWKAGEVRGILAENASAFFIVTRGNPDLTCNPCIGILEKGLDALREAVSQYPDIRAVRIVDCGLMYSL